MPTHNLLQRIIAGGNTLEKQQSITAGLALSLDEPIADSLTDKELEFTLDVSAVKSFYMVSDQDITIETNSGSAADNTIALLADIPYVWHEDSYESFALTSDVTSIFVTNASGATATLRIEALVDPTP